MRIKGKTKAAETLIAAANPGLLIADMKHCVQTAIHLTTYAVEANLTADIPRVWIPILFSPSTNIVMAKSGKKNITAPNTIETTAPAVKQHRSMATTLSKRRAPQL